MTVENNLLQNNRFRITIGGSNDMKKTSYFMTNLTFPGLTSNAVASRYRNNPGFVPSETIEYEALQCTISCDENLSAYLEIYNWIKSNVQNKKYTTYDIVIEILNSHFNSVKSATFKNAFPTSLSSMEFDVTSGDTSFATFTASFQYDEYYFDNI